MTFHDVKDDPILQIPDQDPSMSSKYGLQGQVVPDNLLILLESWNLAHNLRITYHEDLWCQGWPHPPSIQSGTINVPQVWTSRTGVLDTLLILVEGWNFAQKSKILYDDDNWSRGVLGQRPKMGLEAPRWGWRPQAGAIIWREHINLKF